MEAVVDKLRNASLVLMPDLEKVLDYISEHPEVSWNEFAACQVLTDYLKAEDFVITRNFAGCPTGFLAEYKNGDGPKIVYLAKYNALPHFDADGHDAHGCGHNWVAALSVGAAVTLRKMQDSFHGTISVVGAPEGSFFKPKVDILYSDYFRDVDAVFAAHLNDVNLLYSFPLPIHAYEIVIRGERSQAFSYPNGGMNVVHCLMDSLQEICKIKEQLQEFDRINYTICEGSQAVDFVPDFIKLRLAVGGTSSGRLQELSARILEIFEQVCQRYGAKLEIQLANEFEELLNLDSFHQLMEECFQKFNVEYRVMPEVLARTQLDIAPVSWKCPMQYMFFGVSGWISHQPTLSRITASHSPEAKAKLLTAIRIFSCAGMKILLDEELKNKIRSEFEEKSIRRT